MFHICFIYFHLAFKTQRQQQLQLQLNIDDNATTQQQLDYAVCMCYQPTCWRKKLFKQRWSNKLLKINAGA